MSKRGVVLCEVLGKSDMRVVAEVDDAPGMWISVGNPSGDTYKEIFLTVEGEQKLYEILRARLHPLELLAETG